MRRLLFIGLLFASTLTATAQEPVRFLQFTDAHLFDDGEKEPREDAFITAADDRRAMRWSVLEMNKAIAGGFNADFAVYTGDLGLENVDFTQSRCAAIPVELPTKGLPPFRLDVAVDEVATLLAPLKVPRIYFLAGNNDAVKERISDAGRFSCFMAMLQQKIKEKGGPDVYPLLIKNAFVIRGIRFAGLDTVSFGRTDAYTSACAISPEPINCPREQINLLGDLVDDSPQPVLVFTHYPDLIDYHQHVPVWKIDDPTRKDWWETACKPKFIGIFAGHFHDDHRETYPIAPAALTLTGDKCVTAKTRLAPPLAAKYQARPGARGFLRAVVSTAGIQNVSVTWYETHSVVPPATAEGAGK